MFEKELNSLQEKGLWRSLKNRSSSQETEIVLEGRKVLNFCSNNYLNLANDPRLLQAAQESLRQYGFGSGAARLISGNIDLYESFEQELADWKNSESALLFNSGYHANIGVIPVLAQEGDVILSDELNHASLIDGCRLSRAKTLVYRHNDLNHLEELLKISPNPSFAKRGEKKIIITEAVFSMEGDVCPIEDLLKLVQKYDALLYLDEAHAIGVFGKNGEGLVSDFSDNVITMGTCGKAMGSYGAFVCGSKNLKDFLINKSRSFIFSTALPPSVVAASRVALKIIQQESERREQLWKNIKSVGASLGTPQSRAQQAAPLRQSNLSPIFSIRIGDAEKTMQVSQKLLEKGIYVQGIRPPTVPEGTSRLRLTLMSSHTKAQLEKLQSELSGLVTV